MVVYQHLFGSNIKADSDYTYKQPKVKKWVNSTLCNKILGHVVQIDVNQFFPKIASMYLDYSNPNDLLIGQVCAKFTTLRDQSTGDLKDKIKAIVNSLIGYLATKESTYAKME